jgi:Holliday junction resolvase
MAATPEVKVKKQCIALLRAHSAYYFFPVMGGFGRAGVPDIVCCVRGAFLAIECKAGKNKPTALQEAEMQKIRDAGGSTLVINEDNIHQLQEWLHERSKQNGQG